MITSIIIDLLLIVFLIPFYLIRRSKSRLITKVLIEKNCFLTHTLYYGAEHVDLPLYTRINFAVNNSRTYKICASTIKDGDSYINSFQEGIGIILRNGNVKFCAHEDAGSSVDLKGVISWADDIVVGFLKPSKATIIDVIENRKRYNEFRILNYKPIGIFIRNQPNLDGGAILFNKETVRDFYNKTKHLGLNYYYLTEGKLYRLVFENDAFNFKELVTISNLYK